MTINLLLSGDNAIVIAMAARSLPAAQQRRAVLIGSAAAIVMRIGLTLIAARMTLGVGELQASIHLSHHDLAILCGAIGALIVVAAGKLINLRNQRAEGTA